MKRLPDAFPLKDAPASRSARRSCANRPNPLGPPVPPGFWAIIQRCLAKEPAQRYQRAGEIQAALEAVQSGAIAATDPGADISPPRTTVLHSVRHAHVQKGDFLLLVGTTKGAFILRSNAQRSRWEVGGPYFHGHNVYAMAYDGRAGQHRIWASTQSYWGTLLRSSDDFGKSWTNPQQANIRFPSDTGVSLKNIWQITLGRPEEPNVLYCGVEPAALFETHDAGETWSLVRGLFDHPIAPVGCRAMEVWLCTPFCSIPLTISECTWLSHPAGFTEPTTVDVAGPRKTAASAPCSCPINIPNSGNAYIKSRCTLSVPNASSCKTIGDCIALTTMRKTGSTSPTECRRISVLSSLMHPRNPDCVYIVPVESDEFRCACDGRLRVYRTRNAGASWEPLMRGLPQKRAYETVLRDAMAADSFDPAGIYFGTRSGQLFGSRDEGKTWQKILEGLPSVVCVRSADRWRRLRRRKTKIA